MKICTNEIKSDHKPVEGSQAVAVHDWQGGKQLGSASGSRMAVAVIEGSSQLVGPEFQHR